MEGSMNNYEKSPKRSCFVRLNEADYKRLKTVAINHELAQITRLYQHGKIDREFIKALGKSKFRDLCTKRVQIRLHQAFIDYFAMQQITPSTIIKFALRYVCPD